MLFDYDQDMPPDYARDDARYRYCVNAEEAKVQRLVLTYVEFVEARYGRANVGHTSYKPNKKGQSLRTMRKTGELIKIVEKLEDRDPAHFIAYIFEVWEGRGHYSAFVKKGLEAAGGVAYPSWTYIVKYWRELLKEFLAIKGYKPTVFTPFSDLKEKWEEAVEGKVSRWCAAYDKTPLDYWLTPRHLFPPHLTCQEMPYAKSLWKYQAEVEEKMGFTLEELEGFLVGLFEDTTRVPMTRVPNEECMSEHTLERIRHTEEALASGVDVSGDRFQQQMEEEINPIDRDHPDSVMYFTYGHGVPRKGFE